MRLCRFPSAVGIRVLCTETVAVVQKLSGARSPARSFAIITYNDDVTNHTRCSFAGTLKNRRPLFQNSLPLRPSFLFDAARERRSFATIQVSAPVAVYFGLIYGAIWNRRVT